MKIKCPYCGEEITFSLKILYTQKCPLCRYEFNKISNKSYKFFNVASIMFCIILFAVVENYGNVFGMNDMVFGIISFVGCFLVLHLLEAILLVNINRFKKV